jgi:hypothetical protein
MTEEKAILNFKVELNKLDRSNLVDVRREKILHYLNKAALFLVKKKYRGPDPGPGRLETMHPVLDDLKTLIDEFTPDMDSGTISNSLALDAAKPILNYPISTLGNSNVNIIGDLYEWILDAEKLKIDGGNLSTWPTRAAIDITKDIPRPTPTTYAVEIGDKISISVTGSVVVTDYVSSGDFKIFAATIQTLGGTADAVASASVTKNITGNGIYTFNVTNNEQLAAVAGSNLGIFCTGAADATYTIVIDSLTIGVIGDSEVIPIDDTSTETAVAFNVDHLYYISSRLNTSNAVCTTAAWHEGRYVKPERVFKELDSPFNKSSFDDPMVTVSNDTLIVYNTDFSLNGIKIKYLKAPRQILGGNDTQTTPQLLEMELPFGDEIIDIGVSMAIENFESERFKTQPSISVATVSE